MNAFTRSELTADSHNNIARLFRTAEDALDFLCGPRQHDAHVHTYRCEKHFAERKAAYARANAAVAAEVEKIIAEWRA